MRTIIAPTDFSSVSINAVNYAADMACMLMTNLTIFHVYPIAQPVSEIPIAELSLEALRIDAERKIGALKEELLYRTGKRIIVHNELKAGDLLLQLTEYCNNVNPYAVVMGAETLNMLERFVLGGKTTGAVKRLQAPLFVVPAAARFKKIVRAGLACDLKKVTEMVRVKEIKELVTEFDAELHVLNVSTGVEEMHSAEIADEAGWLREMLGELHPKYHFINDPDLKNGVIKFCERQKLDLLIIIPKKHNLFSNFFRPSHSQDLVLHTRIPVMSLHE